MKVIVHAGVFHADEIASISLIKKFINENFEIERKFKITQEELDDKDTFVVDVGKNYYPYRLNFDHHQDSKLSASNILVFDYISKKQNFSEEFRNHLLNFLIPISEVDLGIRKKENDYASIYNVISSLNNVENGFERAIKIMNEALSGIIETANMAVEGIKKWQNLKQINQLTKIQYDSIFIPNWKELAENEGIMFVIQPNSRSGWQVVSRSTDEFVLPESEKATFRHNSGFMIVFEELKDAIEYVNYISHEYYNS